jgi:hypothetical protein
MSQTLWTITLVIILVVEVKTTSLLLDFIFPVFLFPSPYTLWTECLVGLSFPFIHYWLHPLWSLQGTTAIFSMYCFLEKSEKHSVLPRPSPDAGQVSSFCMCMRTITYFYEAVSCVLKKCSEVRGKRAPLAPQLLCLAISSPGSRFLLPFLYQLCQGQHLSFCLFAKTSVYFTFTFSQLYWGRIYSQTALPL